MNNAQMTIYYFATGHQFGWLSTNPNFIKTHNAVCDWMYKIEDNSYALAA